MTVRPTPPVFVFGSNLKGIHGAGAARFAVLERGAIYGQGIGYQGNSYALPTVRVPREQLPISVIAKHARDFLKFADDHPELTFQLTPVGCGLAGFTPAQIAPLFAGATYNVIIPDEFLAILDAIPTAPSRIPSAVAL